jgi:hypothetical protein
MSEEIPEDAIPAHLRDWCKEVGLRLRIRPTGALDGLVVSGSVECHAEHGVGRLELVSARQAEREVRHAIEDVIQSLRAQLRNAGDDT